MKLPADSEIPLPKLLQYLLVPLARADRSTSRASEGYSIEVFNAVGDTIAVTAVPETALESLREDEILCARVLAA